MNYRATTVMVPVMNPLVAIEYVSQGATQFQVNVPVSLKYAKNVTEAPIPPGGESAAEGNGTLKPMYGPLTNEKVCPTNPPFIDLTHGPKDAGVASFLRFAVPPPAGAVTYPRVQLLYSDGTPVLASKSRNGPSSTSLIVIT